MIHIVEGDLFTTNAEVICHQVNCYGVMGSGVARQVKEKYPEVYLQYKTLCNSLENKEILLGYTQVIKVSDKPFRCIANIFGQLGYGYSRRYTNYEAVYHGFERLNFMYDDNVSFAFPYNFGCGRGGADWNIILKMMEVVFKNREIYIYKKE